MIKVCDAIMGSGKTQAAITFMNEHPERKFVYITPYISEGERVSKACPALEMEQARKLPEYQYSVLQHAKHLLHQGQNFSSTHAAYHYYDQEMLDDIRKYEYTLIVDEDLETFVQDVVFLDDVRICESGDYIYKDGETYALTEKGDSYQDGNLRELFGQIGNQNFTPVGESFGSRGQKRKYLYWTLQTEMLKAFSEVIIMTYMFEASDMWRLLQMNQLPYENIYVRKDETGYRFTDHLEYIPGYVKNIRDMIHVTEHKKLNAIGDRKNSLSSGWYKRHSDKYEQLRRNMTNFCRNIHHAPTDHVLWSSFGIDRDESGKNKKNSIPAQIQAKGFLERNIAFNIKATNKYKDCDTLAYLVNLFENPYKVNYFAEKGIRCDNDDYALTNMVQWIWRSAIRDGHEIWIYIPSKRMRTLLYEWMDRIVAEYDALYNEAA